MSEEIRLVYITASGAEEARAIGRALVEARLAACANVLDPMVSVYRWEGRIREDREAVLIAKTRAGLVADLVAMVESLHGYDRPCVVAFPVVDGASGFLRWVADETSETSGSGTPAVPRRDRG